MYLLFRILTAALFLGSFAFAAPVPKVKNPPDKEQIQGKWQVIQRIDHGKDRGTGVEDCFWTFTETEYSINEGPAKKYTIDESTNPKRMDTSYLGIYEIDGDKLIWRNGGSRDTRPEAMTGGQGYTIIFQRVKK